MRSGPTPVPWIALGCFLHGSLSLLLLIYALGDPTFCSVHYCSLLNFSYLLLGRWGVRVSLFFATLIFFYLPFANPNAREF
jgi:hypothetical protein